MSLLQVSNLSVDFFTTRQVVHAVRDVSFNVAAGERVGLVGESGSGKTTTALALMRMLKPPGRIVSGSARIGDLDLVALRGSAIRAARLKTISYIPQGAMNSLSPVLRVHEQMLDGLADHGVRLSAREAQARVRDALAGVGLPASVADLFPHQLSGGMKQRVCIAIAMMLDPQVIIADEPTSALDVISQRQVIQTLHEAQMRIGCGMVIIGHDMGLMAQATDRIIVMKDGGIAQQGAPRELYDAPASAFIADFMGEANVMPCDIIEVDGDSATIAIEGLRHKVNGRSVKRGPAPVAIARTASADPPGPRRRPVRRSAPRRSSRRTVRQ